MNKEPILISTQDLRASERRFVIAMKQLGYGRFESLQIHHGEFVLDPWPTTVRSFKFGNAPANRPGARSVEFEMKGQIAELFALVRSIDVGFIRVLEIRGGLPFSMELVDESDAGGDRT